jgi:RHS repeat-associated protein
MRTLTDTTGALVGTASYGPYGATTAHTGATTPFGYTGQYTDPTGLIYLRARYYDPATAQFLTVDPAYGQTRARYDYVNGDPIDKTDPSGMHLCPAGDASPDCDGYLPAGPSTGASGSDGAQGSSGSAAGEPCHATESLRSGNDATPSKTFFNVPILPGHGQVRIGFFIRDHLSCFPLIGCFGGDGRGYDVNTYPSENRAFIDADLETGVGFLFVNFSCRQFHADCHSQYPITSGEFSSHISANRLHIHLGKGFGVSGGSLARCRSLPAARARGKPDVLAG